MIKRIFIGTLVLVAGFAMTAGAQTAQKDEALRTVPVRVDVTMTRLQGEKKISSMPFSLLANAPDPRNRRDGAVTMRVGVDVPIAASNGSGDKSLQTQHLGTNLDCTATRLDETLYSVHVGIEDMSVPDGDGRAAKPGEISTLRIFRASNTVAMRDGQTILFGSGTDRATGETIKVEVTLHVIK